MKRSRAIRSVLWCTATLAAWGCARIAGLTGDYRRAEPAVAGAADASGGAPDATAGTTANGGADTNGGATDVVGGSPGSSGTTSTAGKGGTGSGGAGSGGSAGGSAGSGGSAGGSAGSAGGPGGGPIRIGFAEFNDSAAGGDNASSHLANATFTKPPGTAAGDFMLVFFGSDHYLSHLSQNELNAKGWTLLDQQHDYGGDGQAAYLLYKFADATEPDPIVIADINPAPSGNGVQGLLSVYRGVSKASPVNAYEVNVLKTGETNVTQVITPTPAITTTAPNCLLIAGLSPDTAVDAPVITGWPMGFDENHVSVMNPPHPNPYGWANIYSAERHVPKAGAVPASAFTWKPVSATEYYGAAAFVLALQP